MSFNCSGKLGIFSKFRPNGFDIRWTFIIVFIPTLILIIGHILLVIYLYFGTHITPSLTQHSLSDGNRSLNQNVNWFWVAAAFLSHIIICLSAITYCLIFLKVRLYRLILCLIFASVFSVAIVWFSECVDTKSLQEMPIFLKLQEVGNYRDRVLALHLQEMLLSPLDNRSNPFLRHIGLFFHVLVNIANVAAGVSSYFILFSIAALISRHNIGITVEERLLHIITNVRLLKLFLILASAIFISGILHHYNWTLYIVEINLNENKLEPIRFENTVRGTNLYLTTLYVLVLASFAFPAWILLHNEWKKVLREYRGAGDKFWIKESQRAFSFSYIIAIPAPYLVPIFLEIMSRG